jgi:hypothetical protein
VVVRTYQMALGASAIGSGNAVGVGGVAAGRFRAFEGASALEAEVDGFATSAAGDPAIAEEVVAPESAVAAEVAVASDSDLAADAAG